MRGLFVFFVFFFVFALLSKIVLAVQMQFSVEPRTLVLYRYIDI